MRLHKDAKTDLLKNVPLFAGCSKSELQKIASLADELDLGEGATLIREGERGREFIVIAQGTVRVTRNGKQLRELGAGDFIGEIALVADVPRTATVTATSPVRLLVVTDRAFRGLLEQMPSLAKKVLQSLGERLHADAVLASARQAGFGRAESRGLIPAFWRGTPLKASRLTGRNTSPTRRLGAAHEGGTLALPCAWGRQTAGAMRTAL